MTVDRKRKSHGVRYDSLHGNGAKNAPRKRTSTMSAERRAKISAAAKKRWAKMKK